MGLFSNLCRAGADATNTADATAKAVLTMPLLTAAADGRIDKSEVDQLINMMSFSPIFHAIGAKRTDELITEIMTKLKSEGAEAVFSDVQSTLSPQLVETAMCFAIRTALADGVLDDGEKDSLIAMAGRLGLPPEKFGQIFEVMAMMQRRAA